MRVVLQCYIFFFKQKTAYEIYQCDWSSDVCSSDLHRVKTGKPRYPYAVALAEIGHGKFEKGEYPAPDDIRPMYLREPDVTINWEKLRQEAPWGPR